MRELTGDSNTRHTLKENGYNVTYLQQTLGILASTLMSLYCVYAVLHPSKYMIETIPFVLYGILRYLLVVTTKHETHIEACLFDKGVLASVMCWVFWNKRNNIYDTEEV